MGRFTTSIQNLEQRTDSPEINWPTTFTKGVIGLEREGVIIQDLHQPIIYNTQVSFIPGSLEAIRMMRLKGYRVVIVNDQPEIQTGRITPDQVTNINNYILEQFGKAGIMSIDGIFHSTTGLKEDEYAKPNVGMFKRAEREIPNINFKSGWFVGHNIKDVKASEKIGSIPVIVLTGNGADTIKKLETYANRHLLKKTKVHSDLLSFAQSLE